MLASKVWLGADAIQDGRAVEIFQEGSYPLATLPAVVPRSQHPFSDSAIESTKLVRRSTLQDLAICLDFRP